MEGILLVKKANSCTVCYQDGTYMAVHIHKYRWFLTNVVCLHLIQFMMRKKIRVGLNKIH